MDAKEALITSVSSKATQARALKNETQANGGSITLQTQSPVTLGFVNDGFERYVDVVRALRGAGGAPGIQGPKGDTGPAGPAGSITDLTSVPRLLWTIFPPIGKYAKAAIIHDYLYDQALYSKAIADSVFYEAMGVLEVPQWRRWVMYQAVKWFGRGNFQKVK